MTAYAIDSKRQAMRSTGIVEEVFEWVERDGKRRPSEVQARDEDSGMPLWSVEVIYQQQTWGRVSSVTNRVSVGMPQRPVLGEFEPVEFVDLRAEVRVNQAGGLVESWTANRISDGKPATQASGQGSGASSGSGKAA
ncbi:hypothetical protein [Segeticoccus rhizosphaerae]|uniref:hypothetical protein n=1 Tax=Segeticoccus rhizosphaerae TaxID=1104777 RepID=UPI0012655213|nr:hypothetical protein [Segeticoccus rhizosphaerae]